MEYTIQDKKLIWDFDKSECNAAKLKDNNLFIKDIWNMKDTLGFLENPMDEDLLELEFLSGKMEETII